MMNQKLLEINHPWVGERITIRRTKGIVVAARKGEKMLDLITGKMVDDTVQFKIQPDSGARQFWTASFISYTESEKPPIVI